MDKDISDNSANLKDLNEPHKFHFNLGGGVVLFIVVYVLALFAVSSFLAFLLSTVKYNQSTFGLASCRFSLLRNDITWRREQDTKSAQLDRGEREKCNWTMDDGLENDSIPPIRM